MSGAERGLGEADRLVVLKMPFKGHPFRLVSHKNPMLVLAILSR